MQWVETRSSHWHTNTSSRLSPLLRSVVSLDISYLNNMFMNLIVSLHILYALMWMGWFLGYFWNRQWVYFCLSSQDSTCLLTAGNDKLLRIYDLSNPEAGKRMYQRGNLLVCTCRIWFICCGSKCASLVDFFTICCRLCSSQCNPAPTGDRSNFKSVALERLCSSGK